MNLSDNRTTRMTGTRFIPLVLLGALIVFFHSTFAGLMARWTQWDENLSHGLIVNAVFIYLLVQSPTWHAITRTKLQKGAALILLSLLSIAWFLFHLISITLLEQLSVAGLLIALYIACYGLKTTFQHRLLLLLPLFSLPIWDGLTDTLVNLSSIMVGSMIRLIEMPAMIEGNSITIPSGTILIADGCSGIRYFQISLALAFIISLLNNYKEGRLLLSLAIAAMIGLAANWIRIFIIVVVGYETEMQSSLMHDHEYFGWALFAVIMLPALYFAPVNKVSSTPISEPESSERPLITYPLMALAIGPLLSLFVSLEPARQTFAPPFTAPTSPSAPTEMPVAVTAPVGGTTQNAMTSVAGGKIYAQVDRYERKSAKDKLVPYIARLFSNKRWLAEEVPTGKARVKMMRFTHKHDERVALQAQWFQVGTFTTESVLKAKLLQIPTLIGGNDGFTIYTVQTWCEESSCKQAQTRLLENMNTVLASPPRLD